MMDVATVAQSEPIEDEGADIPESVLRRRWLILGVLCASLTTIVVGNTALNTALPSMAAALGMSNSEQQWAVDSYALLFAGFLFTAGTLGDRFGRKGFLQAGVALFGAGSAYATFVADSSAEVIASRAVMGVAGALVMPATLSILVNCFPRHERAKAIAIWSGVAGGTGAVGIVVSGWLVERYWWGSAFAVNLPVTALTFVLGAILVPTSRDREPGALDPIGAGLSIVGLGVFVYGLIEGPHYGWLSGRTLGTILAGLAVLGAFCLWEARTAAPMLDVRLFRNPRFSISSLGMTFVFLAVFGFFFVASQLLQLVLDFGPFESGLRLLPLSVLVVVFAALSTPAVTRFGTRLVVSIGMAFIGVGIFLLSFIDADSGYAAVLLGMLPMALGSGLTMPPMTALIMSAVPRDKAGVGSAMNDTTRELGTTLGVAVLGSIVSSGYHASIDRAVAQVPEASKGLVEESLSGALTVGREIGGDTGAAVIAAARDAWADGLQLSMTIGAAIVLAVAALTFKFLPDDDPDAAVAEEERGATADV